MSDAVDRGASWQVRWLMTFTALLMMWMMKLVLLLLLLLVEHARRDR